MRIVLLTRDIRVVGGVERVINVLMNSLVSKYNYDVEIISLYRCCENINKPAFSFNKKIKFTYLELDVPRPKNRAEMFLESIKLKKIIKDVLKNNQADIIMTFHRLISIATLANKNNINSKIIVTEHGDYYYGVGRLDILVRRIMYKKSDKLVVLTKNNKRIYDKFMDNVIQIPNPVPFKISDFDKKTYNKIISVGRLEEEKGFDDLIDIFNIITREHKSWNLDIFGEGSLKDSLQKKINDLGLQDKVEIKPFQYNIQSVLQKADIYVLPSRTEAFPMVLLEAMECGLPCISFDLPGPTEIIKDNEDGLIVKSRDINDFASKISLLIEDDKKREKYAIKAKENIKRYSLDNIVDRWNDLFTEINI